VAIRKESLVKLGLLKNNKLEAGLFRGECVSLEGDQANMSWISWMKPTSETPDFTYLSAFGTIGAERDSFFSSTRFCGKPETVGFNKGFKLQAASYKALDALIG
jgi:hypothetical protein